METKNFQINKKNAILDVIGKPNEQEVYIFLRSSNLFGETVYGINYNISAGQIVKVDKFRKSSEKGLDYQKFLSKWKLDNRSCEDYRTYFRFWTSPAIKTCSGSSHKSDFIEDSWNFSKEKKLKPEEEKDLEKIVDELKTSHIDFAVRSPSYADINLKFKYINEDPKIVVERINKKAKEARSWVDSIAANCAVKCMYVEDLAEIKHPKKVIIKRKYQYKGGIARYSYKFEKGNKIESWGKSLWFLTNPHENGACFVHGETCARFLDAYGNEIGEYLGFPNTLIDLNGIFKDKNGLKKNYYFAFARAWNNWNILNERGEQIARMDEKGFLQDI